MTLLGSSTWLLVIAAWGLPPALLQVMGHCEAVSAQQLPEGASWIIFGAFISPVAMQAMTSMPIIKSHASQCHLLQLGAGLLRSPSAGSGVSGGWRNLSSRPQAQVPSTRSHVEEPRSVTWDHKASSCLNDRPNHGSCTLWAVAPCGQPQNKL